MDHSNVPPTSTSDNAEEARAPGPPFHTALQPSQVPMYSPNPVPYPVLQRNVGPMSQPIATPMSQPIATPMSRPIAGAMLQPIAGARPYDPLGPPVPYPPRQVSSPAQDPVQISSRPHPQEVANAYLIPPSPSHAKPVSRSSADSFHSSPAPAKQISSRSFDPLASYRPNFSPTFGHVASSVLKSSSRPVRRQQEPPNVIQEMLNKVNREVIRINSRNLIMQSQQILTKPYTHVY